MVQTKCKLNNTELFLKLFHGLPYSVQLNWKQRKKQQNLKNGKVRFHLNIDVRKEMEDPRLNAIECLLRS